MRMVYLDLEEDFSLNVQFDLSTQKTIDFKQAYVAICCQVTGVVETAKKEDVAADSKTAQAGSAAKATKAIDLRTVLARDSAKCFGMAFY